MIDNSGITLNGEKVTDVNLIVTLKDFDDEDSLLLKKGKNIFLFLFIIFFNYVIIILY